MHCGTNNHWIIVMLEKWHKCLRYIWCEILRKLNLWRKNNFFFSIKRFGTLENHHKNDDEGKDKLNEMLDFGSFVIGNIISLQHMLVQKSWHPTFVVLDLWWLLISSFLICHQKKYSFSFTRIYETSSYGFSKHKILTG